MEIKAYRTRFKGQNSFGVPFGDLIPIQPSKEESDAFDTDDMVAFASVTHDRGVPEHPTIEYYQVVFRIIGKENSNATFKLVLNKDHGNPLYYDSDSDLWFQRTWFTDKGMPSKEAPYVDSINTAGTFFVSLLDESQKTIITRVKVNVFPSLIGVTEYEHMLNRLLSIHERMIVNSESAVGVGSRDSRKVLTAGSPEYDLTLWNKLKPELSLIMRMPATLLQKQYTKLPYNKLHRFDNRVIQTYISSGGQWAEGLVYRDDNDTLENRIIKQIIQKLAKNIFPCQKEQILSDREIDAKILNEVSLQFNSEALSWYHKANHPQAKPSSTFHPQTITFHCGKYQEPRYQLSLHAETRKPRNPWIYFKTDNNIFEIRSFPFYLKNGKIPEYSFYPFSGDKHPCGICLTTSDPSVALSIILVLSIIYERAEKRRLSHEQLEVKYSGSTTNSVMQDCYRYGGNDTSVDIITVNNVISCTLDGEPITAPSVQSLYQLYSKIVISPASKFIKKDKKTGNEMDLATFVEARRNYYIRNNSRKKAINKAFEAHNEIEAFLKRSWFKSVSSTHNSQLQKTPLFIHDKHYRAIYNILHEIVQHHPLINCNFDNNLYGVHETRVIYEYWVFYELLDRFLNLGFSIIGDNRQTNRALADLFVNHLLKNAKPEEFVVCMNRTIPLLDDSGSPSGEVSNIEVMLGFNCILGDQNAARKKDYSRFLTPDYFIRVTRDDGYHWYFLDAKYDEYTKPMLYDRVTSKGVKKTSISDICYDKYILRMNKKKFLNVFADYHYTVHPEFWNKALMHKNVIEGAYLIIAKYKNESNEQLSEKDLLCGDNSHGISEEKPLHKYGSVIFRPDKADELTSLLQLIFEYKEGGERIQTGQAKTRNNNGQDDGRPDIFNNNESQATDIHVHRLLSKRPATLHACWDSSSDHSLMDVNSTEVSPQLTRGGKYKYYVICSCGARRYENYCICPTCRHEIIKHDMGNFHFRRSSTKTWDRWNYVCPYCRHDINSLDDDTLDMYNGALYFDETSIDYSAHEEAPPPTDEELLSIGPPDDELFEYS